MLRRLWFFAFLFIGLAFPSPAQQVDASAAGQAVKLDGLWRFHEGDNPAWAGPGFDDSSWQLQPADKQMPQPGNGADPGWGWYRIRVKLPATREPLALTMGLAGCELYVDGSRLGDVYLFDPHHPRRWQVPDFVNVVPLPPELNGRTVTVAVREAYYYLTPRSLPVPSVAPARLAWQLREADSNKRLVRSAPYLFTEVLSLCLGLFSLGLFLLHRRATEYGWAAMWYLVSTFRDVSDIYLFRHNARYSYEVSQEYALLALTLFASAMLIWKFIGARRGGLFRVAMVVIAIMLLISELTANYVLGDLVGSRSLGMLIGNVATDALVLVVTILFLVRMGISAVRGNRDAQLLCIPFTLSSSVWVLYNVTEMLSFAGVMKQWTYAALQLGQATITWMQIFDWLAIASMGVILALRFARSAEREQRLSSELEAARTVQQILVPEEIPTIPGFSIRAVYHPAGQVGGDFYQVLPAPNGGLLAIIGDVSGKGMPAAMTVSLLVGTVRTLAHYTQDPAEILSAMNQRMIGRGNGGFTTALVLRLDADGTLTAANAGHIAPYANGKELDLSNGLPLGITADAAYANSTLRLEAGTTITLLTDGVVEAQNAKGELFGFDRAAAISSETAQNVAEAARAFGQEDDITVVSLALSVG